MGESEPVATTVRRALLRTRGIALFFVLAAGAPVAAVVSIVNAAGFVQSPDIGLDESPRLTVASSDARWPGVQPEDRIVSFNGQALGGGEELRALHLKLQPGPVTVGFARADRHWQLTADAVTRPWPQKLAVWAVIVAGIALWAIGLLAFVARPHGDSCPSRCSSPRTCRSTPTPRPGPCGGRRTSVECSSRSAAP